jgi:SAM-dependent methyltransferase
MAIKGYVDLVDVESVGGWVLDEEAPAEEPIVDVFIGSKYIGSTVAHMDAPDLYTAGLPRSAKRFKFMHPERLQYGDLNSVTVHEHKHDHQLDGNFDQFRNYLSSKYNTPETMMPYCVFFDMKAEFDASLDGYRVSATGDVRIESERFSDVKFRVADEISSTSKLGLPTRGRAGNFWFYPESANLGFRFDSTVRNPANDLIIVELTYRDSGTLVAMPVAVTPVGKLAEQCSALIPEPAMIERVIGPTSDAWKSYVVGGWTNAAQLDWMCQKYMGRKLADLDRILDWGSGCARNTLPIARLAGKDVQVSGVDIDPVNIAWSKEHIKDASFEVSGLLPPLDFADHSFDVVYGLSIFTHLTELAQDLWLAELCRVLKPGGVAFLTFHGEAAAYSRGFSAAEIENYRLRGIEDYVLDRALIEVVDDSNYYRSTFHTTDYLRSRWSKYFDIVGIEGTTGGYQWFAACQKRK